MSWLPFGTGAPAARLRLFCFPYAGGGASAYFKWPDSFPRDIGVCPIQLPGRESRWGEPLIEDFEKLLDQLVEAIPPHLDRPYAFFGYSLGARVAFALTHRLLRHGFPAPIRLIVAANRDPASPPSRAGVHRLPEPEFLDYLQELGGTPREVLEDRDLIDLMLPILRADFALAEAPVPLDPVACPVTACGGADDRTAPPDLVARWAGFTTGRFAHRTFPGRHFFLRDQSEPMLASIVRDLEHDLMPGG